VARDARRKSSQLTEEVTALWSPLSRGPRDPRAERATLRAHALAQIAQSARGGRRANSPRRTPVETPADLPAPVEMAHGSRSTPRLPSGSGAAPLASALPQRRPVGMQAILRSPPRAPARPGRPAVSIALLLLAVCLWSIAYCLAWIELDVTEHVRSAWHDLADVISAAASGAP
jgi:hypothetical protein